MDPVLGALPFLTTPPIGGTRAVGGTSAIPAPSLEALAPNLFATTSTVVSLSGQGLLLSAVAGFRDTVRALPGGITDATGLAVRAATFADSFNALQGALNLLQGPAALGGNPLAGEAAQALNAQAQASYGNGNPGFTTLAQIGINFLPGATPEQGGALILDLDQFASAFAADAEGASALLGQAASAFAGLADRLVGRAAESLATQNLFIEATAGQAAFGLGPAQGNNLLSLANLLALESAGPGGVGTQTIVALAQYTLVASLLS